MKFIEIEMKQCELMKSRHAEEYLGNSMRQCPARIEHIVVAQGRIHRVPVQCSSCVLAKLYRATHVIGNPVLTPDGRIKFVVVDSRTTRRIISEHREELISVRPVDQRQLYLTPRQREALRLLANEEATNISQISRLLKISKPAAHKLVRNSIRKVLRKHVYT